MPKFNKEDFRRDLAPRFKLVPHLDRAILEFDDEWSFTYEPKKSDFAWHPSGDCVPTPTALYESALARLRNEPHEANPAMKKAGPVGHFWHQFLQHLVVHKLEFAKESAIERVGIKGWGSPARIGTKPSDLITWHPFHYVRGAADVAPIALPKYGDYLVDFKTMSSNSFKMVSLPDYFGPKYECQINIYMDFFDLDKAIILCINKDGPHDMKEFEFRRDQQLIDAIYDKWHFVSECLDADEAPTELDDSVFPLPVKGTSV